MSDNLRFPTELKLWKYKIERLARKFGLDFYLTIYTIVTPEEMSEIVAQHGFPTMPHHWRYGQESFWWKKNFRIGASRFYELVVNTVPAYAYLLQLNDVITQKSVMAHVCGHVDMNKNNLYFRRSNRDMLNSAASDAIRLKRLFEIVGRDRVKEFFDQILSFELFIDRNSPYISRAPKLRSEEEMINDFEERKIPKRIKAKDDLPVYMDEFLNPEEWLKEELARIGKEAEKEADIEKGVVFPSEPTKDVLGFILRYAPLESWQKVIVDMVRRHSYYFSPQMRTKLMHEGWATLWQEEIMTEAGMIKPGELTQFASELAGVQRRRRMGINPYRLGYELWKDVKFRWDTGRHGNIWDDCAIDSVKESWDEFAVFKSMVDEVGFGEQEFWSCWDEFSAFREELVAGSLGYPKELFVRNLFIREHLIPAWLRYRTREKESRRLHEFLEIMEPLELKASLLASELAKSHPEAPEEELEMKARRDVYDEVGKADLWLWTISEIEMDLSIVKKLEEFSERRRSGYPKSFVRLPIPPEWPEYAKKFPEKIKLGVGTERMFEVRATYDDQMFLEEFFTKEFCEEHKYFFYKAKPSRDWQNNAKITSYFIENRSFRRIKKRLLFQYANSGLPIIRVADANYNSSGELYLVHEHQGVDLDYWSKDNMYMKDVLRHLFKLWGGKRTVHLETIVTEKEEEKPWWFDWHQTKEVDTGEEKVLNGIKVVFSYGLKKDDPDAEKYDTDKLEKVTFGVPF